MNNGPLTLAEFEQQIDRIPLQDADGEVVYLSERIRPLVLRLLAGERKRCVDEVYAFGDHATARELRHLGDPE